MQQDDAAKLVVPAQRGREAGEQLVRGQLGLGLVVVDVVVDDDIPLGRLARLACPQDDAHRLIAQLAPNEVDELQARGIGLHDDIEQHDSRIGVARQQIARLRPEYAGQDVKADTVQPVALQRETRTFVNRLIVVDDRNFRESSAAADGDGLSSTTARTSSCSTSRPSASNSETAWV